jgi:flagellar biosynthesis anti-sigma factor FlgM
MAARMTNRETSSGALIMRPLFDVASDSDCNKSHNRRSLKLVELPNARNLTWSAREKDDGMARVKKSISRGPVAQRRLPPLQLVQDPQDVRAERVRELKKQIAEGTYEPDPREIARKLLESGF